MAYDERLAERIRGLIDVPDVVEQKMFGGLAFLIGGNMAVAASGQGGLLVRVDPAESDAIVARTTARLMEMRGREIRGWLRVEADDVKTKRQLTTWVQRAERATPARCRRSADRQPDAGSRSALSVAMRSTAERGVVADPAVVDLLDRHDVEVVPALAALALGDHQVGVLEHARGAA